MLAMSVSAQMDTLPVEKVDKEKAPQAIQQALDDKFSMRGGTVTGRVSFIQDVDMQEDLTVVGDIIASSDLSVTGSISVGELHNSSTTGSNLTTADTGTNTTFGTCVTASTLTITTDAAPVMVSFTGTWGNNTVNQYNAMSILIDGDYPTGYDSSKSIFLNVFRDDTANGVKGVGWSFITESLSAGSHTFCLVIRCNGGTWSLTTDSDVLPQFSVMELR